VRPPAPAPCPAQRHTFFTFTPSTPRHCGGGRRERNPKQGIRGRAGWGLRGGREQAQVHAVFPENPHAPGKHRQQGVEACGLLPQHRAQRVVVPARQRRERVAHHAGLVPARARGRASRSARPTFVGCACVESWGLAQFRVVCPLLKAAKCLAGLALHVRGKKGGGGVWGWGGQGTRAQRVVVPARQRCKRVAHHAGLVPARVGWRRAALGWGCGTGSDGGCWVCSKQSPSAAQMPRMLCWRQSDWRPLPALVPLGLHTRSNPLAPSVPPPSRRLLRLLRLNPLPYTTHPQLQSGWWP
jgi:hypothetical protein